MKLNLSWLKDEFDNLKKPNFVKENAENFQSYLYAILKEKLNAEKKWALEEFFVIAMAFRFVDDLLTEHHYVPSICKEERKKGIIYRRFSLYCADVDNLIDKFSDYYFKKIELIKEKVQLEEKVNKLEPNEWLNVIFELGDKLAVEYPTHIYVELLPTWSRFEHVMAHPLLGKYFNFVYSIIRCSPVKTAENDSSTGTKGLITSTFEKAIRFSAFNLCDEDERSNSEYHPICFTLDELATRWHTNKENVIATCLSSSMFHAYLIPPDEMMIKDFNLRRTVSLIKNEIAEGKIDGKYKYAKKKCVRIAKKSITKGGITLEFFYLNNSIKVKGDCNVFIWIEPPLSQRVLGVYSQYIDSARDLIPKIIFIKNEVTLYEGTEEFKNNFPDVNVHMQSDRQMINTLDVIKVKEERIIEDEQKLERSAIISNYNRLSPHAWEKAFQREKQNELINAKVPNASPFQYFKKGVEQWLIKKNYYMLDELNMNNVKQTIKSPNDFSDMLQMVKAR